jgi:hypothetical protein
MGRTTTASTGSSPKPAGPATKDLVADGNLTGTPPPQPDLSELIAIAVRSVPGVAGLHRGAFGEVATYLPGRQLPGVRVSDGRIQIHLTALNGHPVRDLAAAVRAAVQPLAEQPVDVTVEDIALPSMT